MIQLHRRPTFAALAALFLLLGTAPASALTIDTFDTDQSVSVPSPSGSVSGAGILGTERDMEVNLLTGTDVTMATAGTSQLFYSHALGSTGSGLIVWDGVDGSTGINFTGLGGVDFTDGGLSDALGVVVTLNDSPAPITLTVYTDADNFSVGTIPLPGGILFGSSVMITEQFADFTDAGALGGADFTNVGALTLFIDGAGIPPLDIGIDLVVTVAPEPASGGLVALGILGLAYAGRRR